MKFTSAVFASLLFFAPPFILFTFTPIVSAADTIHEPDFIQHNIPSPQGPGISLFGLNIGKGAETLEEAETGTPENALKEDETGQAIEPEGAGDQEEIRPEWRSDSEAKSAEEEKKQEAGDTTAGEGDQDEKAEEAIEIEEEDLGLDLDSMFTKPGQPAGVDSVKVVAILQKGISGGNLQNPAIVHYDPGADEIYVVSGGTHPSETVTVFGPEYFPVASLGKGRGIDAPTGLDLDREGNIYFSMSACEDSKPCLKILNPAFFQVGEIGFADIKDVPNTFQPRAVAVSHDYIYMAGYFTRGVLVLDHNSKFVRWLVPMKARGQEQVGADIMSRGAYFVDDVVVDRNGRIYILSMEAGRIFVLDREWNFLFAFGEKGGSTAKLSQARSLAVDVTRQVIYVVDYMRHAVNLYNYADGVYLFEIGGMGFTPGWFRYPTHVAVDGQGNLIVADYFNSRVQVLYVP